MGRVQRCDLGYRAADLGWSTADSGYSDDFDESQGSRGTNAKDFTVCKSPTITLQLDRAQLKLELCEASVLQNASPKLSSKRDIRGLVTPDSVRRGRFTFKLWRWFAGRLRLRPEIGLYLRYRALARPENCVRSTARSPVLASGSCWTVLSR